MFSPMKLYWRTALALLKLLPIGPRNLALRPRCLPVPSLSAGFLASLDPAPVHLQFEDMKFANEDKFAERIQRELNNTRYACTALESLSRGSSNYMFKGILADPLDDGTTEVAVKHTEGYVAASPELFMAPSRCVGSYDARVTEERLVMRCSATNAMCLFYS